jgi:hypothetical protein
MNIKILIMIYFFFTSTMSITVNPLGRLLSQVDKQLLISTDSCIQVYLIHENSQHPHLRHFIV